MQAHTPPSFLQQYGSWIGYAAAASVTSVMAYMYVNQLSQNNHLVRDVKNLQSQIELIRNQPAQIAKTDTVYVLQTAPDGQSLQATLQPQRYSQAQQLTEPVQPELEHEALANREPARETPSPERETAANAPNASTPAIANNNTTNALRGKATIAAVQPSRETAASETNAAGEANLVKPEANQLPKAPMNLAGNRTFGNEFRIAAINSPVEMHTGISLQRKMHYELASKL
ncbi:MAG TPA: hypothetical protein VGE06_01290, partial [Flavisolibacter sp.]